MRDILRGIYRPYTVTLSQSESRCLLTEVILYINSLLSLVTHDSRRRICFDAISPPKTSTWWEGHFFIVPLIGGRMREGWRSPLTAKAGAGSVGRAEAFTAVSWSATAVRQGTSEAVRQQFTVGDNQMAFRRKSGANKEMSSRVLLECPSLMQLCFAVRSHLGVLTQIMSRWQK